jgi:hypothetical protein
MGRTATIIAALMLATSGGSAQEPVDAPTFDWSGTVTPGATVRLDVGDGNLRVTASADDHMTVHGERRHGGLVFQAVTEGTNVTICAFRRGNRCAIDGVHGHFHIPALVTLHSPSADLMVALPPGAMLIAHTSDGTIEVRGAGVGVTAESGDGDIRIAESYERREDPGRHHPRFRIRSLRRRASVRDERHRVDRGLDGRR